MRGLIEKRAVPPDTPHLSHDERTVLRLLKKIDVSHSREVESRASEITIDSMNYDSEHSSGFVTFKFFDGELIGIEGES